MNQFNLYETWLLIDRQIFFSIENVNHIHNFKLYTVLIKKNTYN